MSTFGFVFPGQGSQKLGMLGDLAEIHPSIKATFDLASEVLQRDAWEIAQIDAENLLDRTDITQPLLLAASVAIWRAWQEAGGKAPSILAGHSLGEYSALVCAEVITLKDALRLVNRRGLYMQNAVPPGTGKMAAIVGLDDEAILAACKEAAQGEIVSPANFNSQGQTVIAGHTAAVERAMVACKEAGAKRTLPLNVSVPSHCELMRPAAEELALDLEAITFSTPKITVVQNSTAEIVSDPLQIKTNLISQLYLPVQWVDSVRVMASNGVQKVVECGPGKVLCGLIKRIDRDLVCMGSEEPLDFDTAITQFQQKAV
ncbi:MAG TPA: [acyl-carrier-protein] S-malonyltransferase [Gammaproteobacteria bacterium]|nr:[acyl-carrier-protein] S-malonyltransferase [Gammaproteobacteria bacterium]